MFIIHQGRSSRVNCNSVTLQCKRYARMRSNFKKFKFQISQVHTGTYRYIPVRTGIDINHTHTLHFDDALAAFLRRRVSTARLTCSSCLALFLTAVSATERPPKRGLPRPNIQSQWLTSSWSKSHKKPPWKASACVMHHAVFCTGTGRPSRSLCSTYQYIPVYTSTYEYEQVRTYSWQPYFVGAMTLYKEVHTIS